jgi:hypothetical protein
MANREYISSDCRLAVAENLAGSAQLQCCFVVVRQVAHTFGFTHPLSTSEQFAQYNVEYIKGIVLGGASQSVDKSQQRRQLTVLG